MPQFPFLYDEKVRVDLFYYSFDFEFLETRFFFNAIKAENNVQLSPKYFLLKQSPKIVVKG